MNEIDIAVQTLRHHGKGIVVGMVVGFILALLVILFQKPVYQAEMIIGPTERTGVPSLSSFLPSVAADAPALQYFVERIDAAQSNDFTVFETRLKTPSTTNQMNASMFPSDNPQVWLQKNLKIRPVGLTQFRKITLQSNDKDKLIPLLNTLYRLTDLSIRQDKKMKVQRRITYLNEQLKITLNPDHRDAMIALLKEQEQTSMMASIDNEFAATVIEPAYIKPKPVSPNSMILFPVLIMIGGFLGFVLSSLRRA